MQLYELDPYCKQFTATITGCTLISNEGAPPLYEIFLSDTAFYPEGGGQPCDLGVLNQTAVVAVRKTPDKQVAHHCHTPFAVGSPVVGQIDWARRFDLMQQHSGEHIVSGIACARFGCDNVGFHIGEEMITIDFNQVLTPEQVEQIEQEANQYIWDNHPVVIEYPTPEQQNKLHYRSKIKITEQIRIVTFPDADCCACCGTHVSSSGGVGVVKLITCHPHRDGVRIELLCGGRALRYLSKIQAENTKISTLLSAKPLETSISVEKLYQEKLKLSSEIAKLQQNQLETIAKTYHGQKTAIVFVDNATPDMLQKLTKLIQFTEKCYCFTQSESNDIRYVLASRDQDLRSVAQSLNQTFHGKGGGKPQLQQGSINATQEQVEKFLHTLSGE